MPTNEYYCHECANTLGFLPSHSEREDFTGSYTTLSKFIKHTSPYAGSGTNSIFEIPDYDSVKDFIVDTQASGSVEFDQLGRKNIVWLAGSRTGFTFKNGGVVIPNDAVKVVCSDDIATIHGYPTSSFAMASHSCNRCGKFVIS